MRVFLLFLFSSLLLHLLVPISAKKDWSQVSDKELDELAGSFEPNDPDNPITLDEHGHPIPPKNGKVCVSIIFM